MLYWNGENYVNLATVGHIPPTQVEKTPNEVIQEEWEQAKEDHIRRYERSIALSHQFGRQLDAPKYSALRRH